MRVQQRCLGTTEKMLSFGRMSGMANEIPNVMCIRELFTLYFILYQIITISHQT